MILRPLLFLVFAGLLILPDWSTARPFRRFVSAPVYAPAPVVYSYPPAPVYPVRTVPVMYSQVPSPAPVVYSLPSYPAVISSASVGCPPVYTPPVACLPAGPFAGPSAGPTPAPRGPIVVPERMPEGKQSTGTNLESRAEPKAAPIRPVSAEERTPSQPPAPMPIPVPSVPARPLGEPIPRATTELAPPKAATEETQKPAVPAVPAAPLPDFPPLGLDKPEPPKSPEPVKVEPAKPEQAKPKATDPLPTFELPPLPPLAPAQPVSSEKPTVAKSSPLNADPVADVYPTAGTIADRAAKRSVGFINKSGRDLLLTVEGKTTTLPAGQYLRVDLPATFTWQLGGDKERAVTVPDTAPGVSVVIRK